ncbi:hypothetical protein ACF0H5_009974 [Mactra antiquata]
MSSKLLWRFVVFLNGLLLSVNSQTQCELRNGACTYNVNLLLSDDCKKTESGPSSFSAPLDISLPALDRTADDVLDTIKSDHENRIKELESSIQKIMRNVISSQIPQYMDNHKYGSFSYEEDAVRPTEENMRNSNRGPSGNVLLLQLQNQFNTLRKTLSERTADLLDARNKLNETLDLLSAAQKQAMDAGNKLVNVENEASVLSRENRILKNKLKHKTEHLDYAVQKLNTTETQLRNSEERLYDVIRSESTIKEELLTVKLDLDRKVEEFDDLLVNYTELGIKYKKIKRKLSVLEVELNECFLGKNNLVE